MIYPSFHQRTLLAAVILAATGAGFCFAAEPPSTPTQDQILARIDSLHVSRQVEAAATFIEPHLTEARAADDSVFTLPLAAKLGRLWAAFGQPKKGEPLLREAVALATALEDSLRLCDALRWLGLSVEQQGRSTEAVALYRRQLEIARSRGDRRHEAWALVGLAYRAGQEGRYHDAVEDYRVAAGIFEDLDQTEALLWTLNGLGAVLEQKGSYTEAAAHYGMVADLGRRVGYQAVEALALNNQGALEFSLGDPGVALEHFRRARALQGQISQRQDAVSTGTNVANCLVHLGRLDEAAVLLDELLQECEQGHFTDREAYVLNVLADVRRRQGRRREAVSIYRRILLRDDESLDFRSRIESATGLAGALAEIDSSATALAVLQEIERHGQERLTGVPGLEFQLAMSHRLRETGQTDLALARYRRAAAAAAEAGLKRHRVTALAGAARCLRERGEPDQALALLRQAAAVWEDTRKVPLDPEWREQHGASGRLVYPQLAALMLAGRDHAGSVFDAVQPFKARTLAERIEGRDKADDLPAMTLEKLQAEVLKEDEVFLDAYLGPDESILFAVTRSECRAIPWPAEPDLARRLRLFHEMLSTPPAAGGHEGARRAVAAVGEKLRWELLGQVEDLLRDQPRVILAPDGAMNLVPWSTPGGRQVWVRVPSATILGVLRSQAGSPGTAGRGILAAAAAATPEGRPLPGALREVNHLAKRFRDVDLRLAALQPADLGRFDILHLATHARVDDQRPWSSEIVLNAADPAGRIRADQIAVLDLAARLAVLSACQTGSGRILSGEGVLGLTSAFLSAGVPTVVASLWPVADGVTAVLMEQFYEELARGSDPATALWEAQAFVRLDPATAHPFHWAGFVVVGEGTASVDLATKKPERLFLALAGLLVLIGVLLVRIKS